MTSSLVGLFLTFALPLNAGVLTRFCGDQFARLAGLVSDGEIGSKLGAKLKAFLAAELPEMRRVGEKFLDALPPGSLIKIKDMEYRVVSFLGDGSEGTVYLAEGPLGRKTVKQFKGTTEILAHLEALNRLGASGVPTPRIWSVDERNRTAVLDYVEGLSVEQIRRRGGHYGLTDAELTQIEGRLAQFRRRMIPLWPKFKEQNIIMDFNTGQFVVVDPI